MGLSLGLNYFNISENYVDGTSYADSRHYSLGPFVSYHRPVSDSSNLYIHFGLGYTKAEYDFDNSDLNREEEGKRISMSGGWEYFFTSTIACKIGLNFMHADWDYTGRLKQYNNDTSNSFSTNAGLNIFF